MRETAKSRTHDDQGLRLLALDGGGIRGLSELIVLREIMQRIEHQEHLDATPRPCEYFDLIGGTSTGGLIALMLGRLCMPVEDAILAYGRLTKYVFSEKKWYGKDGTFKATKLEQAIKEIVKMSTQDADKRMIDQVDGHGCRTFVCATPALNMSAPRLFRTYKVSKNQSYNCTIWQAARATSAAPTFFKRIYIGDNGLEEEFVDGGLGCNNPVAQVLEEAESVFGQKRRVACIVSIGTGQPETIGLPTPDAFQRMLPIALINVLKKIATDCEQAAEQFEKRYKDMADVYFRFNVEQGMQRISLAEWDKLGEVATHTTQYIQRSAVSEKISRATEALRKRSAVVTDCH